MRERVADESGLLTEPVSKSLFDVYQIPNTKAWTAATLPDAEALAEQIGYPVVMKLLSPDITHKSDVGGVQVNLQNSADVRRAFEQITGSARESCSQARIDGVSLQRYVNPLYSLELILGCRRDPIFGPLLMIGMGGVATEVFRDCAFELPPLDERLAYRLLERLRCYPILRGFRNRPALAIDRLIEVMLRFSTFIVENPAVLDCDINPLIVSPDEVIAVDARVLYDPQVAVPTGRPYSHLALAPYPQQLAREITLRDGAAMTIRPIRPEDEPAWHRMLDAASEQAIWQRFRSMIRASVHRQAARYCFIDYDREMAFVAEAMVDGESVLAGVARLVADRNLDAAEFAVLVIDDWQRRGVGRQLLDACLEYAAAIGLKKVTAEMNWDNAGMLTLFRSRGFEVRRCSNDPTTLFATRQL